MEHDEEEHSDDQIFRKFSSDLSRLALHNKPPFLAYFALQKRGGWTERRIEWMRRRHGWGRGGREDQFIGHSLPLTDEFALHVIELFSLINVLHQFHVNFLVRNALNFMVNSEIEYFSFPLWITQRIVSDISSESGSVLTPFSDIIR